MASVERRVVFQRAINGAPKNRISMVDYAALIESCGYRNVTTYLATGNAVMLAPVRESLQTTANNIETAAIERGMTNPAAVSLHPHHLHELRTADPFRTLPPGITPGTHHLAVSVLITAPDGERIVSQATRVAGKGVHVLFRNDQFVCSVFPREPSALNINGLLESAWKCSATTRWWNVIETFTEKHLPS
jgi:uncharacterized protein (DUF1697 family)